MGANQQPLAPPPLLSPSAPLLGAEAEYKSLLSLFKNLVWISGIGLSIITVAATALVAIGSYFFWANLRDVRQDAKEQAAHIATAEAERGVKQAFDEKNINELVQKVAREKINAVTDIMLEQKIGPVADKMIEQHLTSQLQPIQQRILLIGRISECEARIHRGDRTSLEELTTIMDTTRDSDVRQFARSTLTIVTDAYESAYQNDLKILRTQVPKPLDILQTRIHTAGSPASVTLSSIGDAARMVRDDRDLDNVAIATIIFRDMTGDKNIKMFDFKAVSAWCASHEPKCKEPTPSPVQPK